MTHNLDERDSLWLKRGGAITSIHNKRNLARTAARLLDTTRAPTWATVPQTTGLITRKAQRRQRSCPVPCLPMSCKLSSQKGIKKEEKKARRRKSKCDIMAGMACALQNWARCRCAKMCVCAAVCTNEDKWKGGRGANSTRNRGNLHLPRLLKEEGQKESDGECCLLSFPLMRCMTGHTPLTNVVKGGGGA